MAADITQIMDILRHRNKSELAKLLKGSSTAINESSTYGSRLFSTLSTFEIYSPLTNYEKLKNLNEADKNEILKAAVDSYPVMDYGPEIVAVRFILGGASTKLSVKSIKSGTVKNSHNLNIFMSHSTKDLNEVMSLASELQCLGFGVFIAHRDIVPSHEWLKEIVKNVKSNRIFVAFITQNFKESDWCDQESGIAYVSGKKIIPVIADGIDIPYGFMNKFQKLDASKEKRSHPYKWDERVAQKIFEILSKEKKFKADIRNNILEKIPMISSYCQANSIFRVLRMLEPFTKDELKVILKEFKSNRQIYEAGDAVNGVEKLIEEHAEGIKDSREFEEAKDLLDKIKKR